MDDPTARDIKENDVSTPAERAEGHWTALADLDAIKAGQALAALEEISESALALLRERLKPITGAPAGQIERWIADLDSETFAVRTNAQQELHRHREEAAPALRKLLEGKPSAEAARQAKEILKEVTGARNDPERLRQTRAVELLERIGTPEARTILEEAATGLPTASLTLEAKAALARWPRR
jgi:hypothetical protein